MNFTFLNTGFDMTKNGLFEGFYAWWMNNKRKEVYWITDYKYVEPDLEIRIKIPKPSHVRDKSFLGDYCVCSTDLDTGGTSYYCYYVTNVSWKARETVEVTLALDTLTTFFGIGSNTLPKSLTSESHITRKFKDRYTFKDAGIYAIPKVDNYSESFNTVPTIRDTVSTVDASFGPNNWTLVYITEYASDTELAENPVSCYIYPSSKVSISTTQRGTRTWTTSTWSSDRAWAWSTTDNPYFSVAIGGRTISYNLKTSPKLGVSCWLLYSPSNKTYTLRTIVSNYAAQSGTVTQMYENTGDSITFNYINKVYQQDYDYVNTQVTTTTEKYWPYAGKMNTESPVSINAGSETSVLPAFSTWYAEHKTDSRIVKIRELPYPPFDFQTTSEGVMVIPSGWEITADGLKFAGTTFGSYTLNSSVLDDYASLFTVKKTDIVDTDPSLLRETKLLNSDFYTRKFVYDTSYWSSKLENDKGENPTGLLSIDYKVSDGLDNGLAFKFDSGQYQTTDFGDYLVCDRNTDKPYFTNEYLNYVKYGKYYDEKATRWNIGGSVVSSAGSIASTLASGAFAGSQIGSVGGGWGAVVGAAVGIVSASISIAKTASTAWDSINSKISQYQSQASSVSGANDLSLFRYYSGNKLLEITYKPYADISQMLYGYFRQFGYACDEYGVPTMTRRYVDYFVIDPVFNKSFVSTFDKFLDDITARLRLGFRCYHNVNNNTYDINLTKENWETSLWTWANSN